MYAIQPLDTLEIAKPRWSEPVTVARGDGAAWRAARGHVWSRPTGEVAASTVAVIAVILTSCVAAGGLGGSEPGSPSGIVHHGDTHQQTILHAPDVNAAS